MVCAELRFEPMTALRLILFHSIGVCSRDGLMELQRKLGYGNEWAVELRLMKQGIPVGVFDCEDGGLGG